MEEGTLTRTLISAIRNTNLRLDYSLFKWELGLKHVRVVPSEHTLHIREFQPLVPRHAPQVLRSESLAEEPHIRLLHVPEVLSPAVQESEVMIWRK